MNATTAPTPARRTVLSRIIEAHCPRTEAITIKIDHEGKEHELIGKITAMVDLSTPTVELLSEQSTPTARIPKEDAIQQFEEKAARLIEHNESFCTTLRMLWNLPNITWNIKKK